MNESPWLTKLTDEKIDWLDGCQNHAADAAWRGNVQRKRDRCAALQEPSGKCQSSDQAGPNHVESFHANLSHRQPLGELMSEPTNPQMLEYCEAAVTGLDASTPRPPSATAENNALESNACSPATRPLSAEYLMTVSPLDRNAEVLDGSELEARDSVRRDHC